MNFENNVRSYYEAQASGESLGRYTAKTFGWMFAGLMVTFIVAVAGLMTGAIVYVYSIPYWYYLLLIAEVGTVIFLSARIEKLSVGAARALFFLYAALNGVVFCAYLILFDLTVLWMAFGITSLFFGIMALIGWFGNINFASLRPFMMGGLVFLVVYWLLAMFIDLSAFSTLVCGAGIFLFLLFTAYDTKKIQAYHAYYGHRRETAAKETIVAEPPLLQEHINLFGYLVQKKKKKK